MESVESLTRKEKKDLRVLALFTSVYCKDHHAQRQMSDPVNASEIELKDGSATMCEECQVFLLYACDRRIKCPLDPKPTCKNCHIHCYRQGHRERVREIMKYSGMKLIKRGRIDLLWHYFF